jgi:hypothetical protein
MPESSNIGFPLTKPEMEYALNKKVEKRFYVAKSMIYGLTVYDRESQTPAFEQGAGLHMTEYQAQRLCSLLNK